MGNCVCSPSGGIGLAGIVGGNLMSTGPTTTTTVMLGAKTTSSIGGILGVGIGGGLNGGGVGNGNPLNDDGTTSNAETLLSSNARFQAISAITVAQNGVINVADQGKFHFTRFILLKFLLNLLHKHNSL